jgi:UrcA family protein
MGIGIPPNRLWRLVMRHLIAAGLILAAATTNANAAPIVVSADSVPTARIAVGDLNLASSAGQRVYLRRLGLALESVCGSYANAVEMTDENRITDCRHAATTQVQRQLAEHQTEIRLAWSPRR